MKTHDRFFRNLFITILVMLSMIILYKIRSLIPPVLCGLLLAYILYPIIHRGASIGIPKKLSIFFIFMVIAGTILYSFYRIIPTIEKEIALLTSNERTAMKKNSKTMRIVENISEQLYSYKIIKEKWKTEEVLTKMKKFVNSKSSPMLKGIGKAAKSTGQFIMIFLFVFIFALIDGDKFYKTIIKFIPNAYFEPGLLILRRTTDLFGYYLRGLVIENLILGIAAFILLLVLSFFTELTIVLAFIIALIIALTNVIRIVGPIIGGVAGVFIILIFNADLLTMGGVLIIAVIIQLLDNVAVLPLVMQEQVDIHPVICLLSVLGGGILAGMLGMILAIPFTAAIKVIFHILTVEMKKFNMLPEPALKKTMSFVKI